MNKDPTDAEGQNGETTARRVNKRPLDEQPTAVKRLPGRAHHGVGSKAAFFYCECGAKKHKGVCVRGCGR